MSIKLPSALTVSGIVGSASQAPVSGFKVRVKLLAPDGASIATINDETSQPLEAKTTADGKFSLTIKDSQTVKQLLTQGYSVLFKSGDDDSPSSLDEGLSRSTPLHLDAKQSVSVQLCWQQKQAGDATKPAVSAKLAIISVSRDGKGQSQDLVLAGRVEGSQGLPVGDLVISASLIVPGTGQVVEFPQPIDRPPVTSTAQDGSFQLVLVRGGDLMPFQPYSVYGVRLSARAGQATGRSGAAAATVDLCHLNPQEGTQIRLRWDASDPAKPSLKVACIHRDGKACKAAEGTLKALGQLIDAKTSLPLVNHRVRVQAGAALQSMGEVRTGTRGFFALLHPWPLSSAASDVSMSWKLQILDPNGNSITKDVLLSQDGLMDAALPVQVTLPSATDTSPTVKQTLAALKQKLDPKTQAALDAAKISTLRTVLQSGGLGNVKGTEKADVDTLLQLERSADLWSLFPSNVAADGAVKSIAVLLGKGISGTEHLGNLPRAAGTSALSGELGDFAGAQTHAVAAARNNLLNFLLLGARIEARQTGAVGVRGLRAETLGAVNTLTALLPESTAQGCSCSECQTAVSPNAYLMDLIRYAYFRVKSSGSPLGVDELQSTFFQPFADLPTSCASMNQPVLTTRLAIEILRAYGATLTLSTTQATTLASNLADYVQQAYDAILSELGTSRTELRLALGNADQLSALADQLAVPSATEVQQFLIGAPDEATLESRFGLRASTRAPMDTQPVPDLLTWRLTRLRTAWRIQDAPARYPTDVPILDPDVLDLSNLRKGWDSTHATTLRWTARRSDIDTQLANIRKSRALAIGAAVMTVTQPTVMSPSEDQKWAAYLTVSLSDDEVQSKAATLSISEQDQAKPKAAKSRVEKGKVARGGSLPLSTDEQSSINAVLNYTGTSLNQQTQDAAQTWIDAQFTGLTPTSGSAISPIGGWVTLHSDLKGIGTGSVATATQELARFSLSVDAFLRGFDLRMKLTNQGFRTVTDDDWAEFAAIFVMRWKSGQFATWITQEQADLTTVSADLFWVSPTQPAQPKWLGSPERYQQWLTALDAALSEPIINPALLGASAFISTDSADPAYPAFDLWQQRTTWLGNTRTALDSARSAVDGAAAASKLSTFDDQVLSAMLLIPKVGSAANRWYEPAQLQLAYDKGAMTGAHLAQLLLDRNGFQSLFALRSLIRDGKATTDQEWQPAQLALLKAVLQRKYGAWRMEEAAQNISQSPVFFQLPAAPQITFPPQSAPDDAPNLQIYTKVDLQKWRKIVSDRIQQEARVNQDQADLIDRVEQSILGLLREILLGSYFLGFSGTAVAETMSDRFLFDFLDSPTNKTSRVAQAIATLQQLIFALRTGELFRYRTSATSTLYPTLTLEAEHIETEWQWMGSYGSWRSALFIFMYPENLLYPTLRNTKEQSETFQSLASQVRSRGTLTPEDACFLASEYREYFAEISQLTIQACCIANAPINRGSACASYQIPQESQELILTFALAPGGHGYWMMRTRDFLTNSYQSIWTRVPVWDHIVAFKGTVPYRTQKGQHFVAIFAFVRKKDTNQTTFQVLRLDLDKLNTPIQWAKEAKELELPTQAPGIDVTLIHTVEVEQFATNSVPGYLPRVYVAKLKKPSELDGATDIYIRELNEDANGWASDYYIDTIPLLGYLDFGFSTAETSGYKNGYNFIFRTQSGDMQWWFKLGFGVNSPTFSFSVSNLAQWGLGIVTGIRVVNANLSSGVTRFAILFTNNNCLIYSTEIGASDYYQVFTQSVAWNSVHATCELLSPTDGLTINVETLDAFGDYYKTDAALSPSGDGLQFSSVSILRLPDGGISNLRIPSSLPLTQDSQQRKAENSFYRLLFDETMLWSPSHLISVFEAMFSVPLLLGSSLQQSGYYLEALSWYRSIYDFSKRDVVIDPIFGDMRKLFYGLVAEETEPEDNYTRTQQWIADPYNPHAIAGMRRNAYTRFTLLTIIRCLIEYADSEFASDTSESVPRARELYLDALQLLDQVELAVPGDCSALVAQMDFTFVPTDWQGATAQLQVALAGTMAQLAPASSSQLRSSVTAALKDTTKPKWADRFANAYKAIKAARATVPKPPKFSAAFKNERSVRTQAQLALLAVPEWQRIDAALQGQIGQDFRSKLSALTGVVESSLQSDSTLKLDWLSKPGRTRKAVMDPAKRSPELVQPTGAIRAEYKRSQRWEPLMPTAQGLAGQQLAAAPAMTAALIDPLSVQFVPTGPVSFCIPPNPVIAGLRLRAQLNLYKLRSGRNITGVQRQLDFYAAPTDAQSDLPSISANGGLSLAGSGRTAPTEYRYPVLLERARRQIQVAAQFESQLLQSLEQADNQRENLLRARNELATQQAVLNVKKLEIQEAQLGVSLVQIQQQKNTQVQNYLQDLINENISALEIASMAALSSSVLAQYAAVALGLVASFAFTAANANPFQAGSAAADSFAAMAQASAGQANAFSTIAQILRTSADFQRRRKDWQQQKQLANFDAQALGVQLQQANLHVQIKQEDANLTSLAIEHAQSVVDFLITKFTNAELFEWMSRILQGLYAEQLQRATVTARLAQQQLTFDLLQSVDVIQTNYWNIPVQNALPGNTPSSAGTTDRKGLTGAERLLADLEQLDTIAAQQTTRKLQLTRTISLATVAPGDFQRLKETGEMWFQTTEQDFDQEFPGHYFRRIHKIRVSVLALVPPARGIRATLTNIGPSRVTVPGTAGFELRMLPASNESVSLTSPQNGSGLFELDIQSELKLPFEGVGVDTLWHFELPMPANPMDFDSIADVQVTFEYTARYSADYRAELVANPQKLPRVFSAVRVFSFRAELADQWYALHNPPLAPAATDISATFTVDASDFPRGMDNVRVKRLTLYMPISPDSSGNKIDLSKDSLSKSIGLAFGASATPAYQSLDPDSLVVAQSAADAWFRQLPARTLSPFGTWTLVLPNSQTILDLLRNDQIKDILLAITYEAALPEWPSGLRPKRALF